MRAPISLGLGSYESISKPISAQRCVNLYAGVSEAAALKDYALFSTPGIYQLGTTGAKPSRGAAVMGGVLYVVCGTTLYSVDSSGTATSIGTISGTSRVSMADNGEKLAIVAPDVATNNLWEYNATADTLTRVSDVDYIVANSVAFKDGYYLFVEQDGQKFFCSNLNQPLVFDALDYTNCNMAPDNNVTVFVNYDANEVYILGEETTEVYQNIGGSGFPFQIIRGASFEKGSHSNYMPVQWAGFFYFMGGGVNEKTSIYKARGAVEPIKISTDAIDNEIQKFTSSEIDNAFPFTYAVQGHAFIGFTIESVNITSRTFVYNVTASELSGRQVWLEMQTGVSENAWRVASVDTVYNKLLVSDRTDGRIGVLDVDTHTEYGNVILREKITEPLSAQGKSIFIPEIELTIDSGQGIITGQGSDPEIMMQFSKDGARTWSNELWRKMGKIGEYSRRVSWRKLGRAPSHIVFRFRVSDPIDVTVIKAEVEVSA